MHYQEQRDFTCAAEQLVRVCVPHVSPSLGKWMGRHVDRAPPRRARPGADGHDCDPAAEVRERAPGRPGSRCRECPRSCSPPRLACRAQGPSAVTSGSSEAPSSGAKRRSRSARVTTSAVGSVRKAASAAQVWTSGVADRLQSKGYQVRIAGVRYLLRVASHHTADAIEA